MVRVRIAKKPLVLKPSKRQIGTSKIKIDKRYKALKPGKRISKYGRIYYEYRKNRSDKDRRKRLWFK